MHIHSIKIKEIYANEIYKGNKKFEVRYNDRNYQVKDMIRFKVIDDDGNLVRHKLNLKHYEITYVLEDFIGLANGYVAFGIREI